MKQKVRTQARIWVLHQNTTVFFVPPFCFSASPDFRWPHKPFDFSFLCFSPKKSWNLKKPLGNGNIIYILQTINFSVPRWFFRVYFCPLGSQHTNHLRLIFNIFPERVGAMFDYIWCVKILPPEISPKCNLKIIQIPNFEVIMFWWTHGEPCETSGVYTPWN